VEAERTTMILAGGPFSILTLVVATALIGSNVPFLRPVIPSETTGSTHHPAALHAGTCAALRDVTAVLADVVEPSSTPQDVVPAGASVTIIESTLDQLLAAPRAITVSQSHAHPKLAIACGTIGGAPVNANIVVGLAETNDSGYSGIAWLHDNSDGTTTITLFVVHHGAQEKQTAT
jgi:hypothetical protein